MLEKEIQEFVEKQTKKYVKPKKHIQIKKGSITRNLPHGENLKHWVAAGWKQVK